MTVDQRIPIRFGPLSSLRAGEAVLLPEGAPDVPAGAAAVQPVPLPALSADGDAPHPIACACCVPRGPVASALSRLYFARVRGEVGFFTGVLAPPAAEAAIREAIRRDPIVGSRYRAAPSAA